MTVVATRTEIAPCWKAAITSSFSGPFIRPWTSPTLSPKRSLSSSRTLLGRGLVGSLALLDQRADPISLAAAGDVAGERVDDVGSRSRLSTRVSIGWRPGGISSRRLTSISP